MYFIGDLSIASSDVHIIPEWSHQIVGRNKETAWERFVEPMVVCSIK